MFDVVTYAPHVLFELIELFFRNLVWGDVVTELFSGTLNEDLH
jgi:hypothetical protein